MRYVEKYHQLSIIHTWMLYNLHAHSHPAELCCAARKKKKNIHNTKCLLVSSLNAYTKWSSFFIRSSFSISIAKDFFTQFRLYSGLRVKLSISLWIWKSVTVKVLFQTLLPTLTHRERQEHSSSIIYLRSRSSGFQIRTEKLSLWKRK